ncbi:MAG TPA: diphthine synthase, partial [Nanoarchaeota archaeon]|nr:diphthine synthase [Nanoarchaeota archaeon]
MLYIIGIGLGNEKDISINGLESVRSCDVVYLENYTSKLMFKIEDLEKLTGKKIILADRELVESGEEILKNANEKNVALLVKG